MSTVVVRGAGGTLYEMDEPTSGHALERWVEKIAKGDLVIVSDPVEWVDVGEGVKQLRVIDKPAVIVGESTPEPVKPTPARRGKAAPKTDPEG